MFLTPFWSLDAFLVWPPWYTAVDEIVTWVPLDSAGSFICSFEDPQNIWLSKQNKSLNNTPNMILFM